MDKTPAELYQERRRRIDDAIQLKPTDRVPVWFQDLGLFPARYTGMTSQESVYNYSGLLNAHKKTIVDYQPDMYLCPGNAQVGQPLDILGSQQYRWPGQKDLDPNFTLQFIEGEYMKADEYDAFLRDPSDWALRTYLPRIFSSLKPLSDLPDFKSFLKSGIGTTSAFTKPEILTALEKLYQAGVISAKTAQEANGFKKEMDRLGFPLACGGSATIPFDLISDNLRGMKGTMLDMYRQPDKLLEAIDALTPVLIEKAIRDAKGGGAPACFLTLHRGADGFMSRKQFETFYWPGLKKMLLALVDNGITPFSFFEGDYTSRLEFLTELPKGKILGCFDTTDIFKAKKVLGGTMCISGMMPLSLLQTGTPEQIKDYAKQLIDVVGRDGGFIMGPKSAMNECDPIKLKIWIDFTKEYGVYK